MIFFHIIKYSKSRTHFVELSTLRLR